MLHGLLREFVQVFDFHPQNAVAARCSPKRRDVARPPLRRRNSSTGLRMMSPADTRPPHLKNVHKEKHQSA